MRPRLKENPREWIKFTTVMALFASVLSVLLWRKQVITQTTLWTVLTLAALAWLICLFRPRWFRPFYRTGMTVSFYVGQLMGRVFLAIVFLAVVTPTGLILRMLGKDLLALKKRSRSTTYWCPARATTRFDRQF